MTEEQFEALRKWIGAERDFAGLQGSIRGTAENLTLAGQWVHKAEDAARAALVTETK